ncbi:CU044_2847 family protein [Rhodoferax sp. BLA1]|uniref:CU044_2847 family protein n=1 Tax=Rhodoferax sp. BLA1 TaxID=2576062 RepID=UPI0015D38AFF|nr:CU044_2847 family protein [Rhodoferax sp. BLA1]
MASTLKLIDIDGQPVWVEVTDIPVSASPDKPGRFADTSAVGAIQDVTNLVRKVNFSETLKAVVGPVYAALQSMAPEEATVELSLGIKGEVGIFVASSEATASIKVSAKWKFPKSA